MIYDGVVGPWFLSAFLTLSGVAALHYVLLLPPLDVCLHRVERRVGHGFSDLAATRQMYEQFAAAAQDLPAHVVSADMTQHELAELIQQDVDKGRFRYTGDG